MIHRLPLIILTLAAILLSLNATFAAEKLAPAGSKQGPDIFVQPAKESIMYFSGLKFMQEA